MVPVRASSRAAKDGHSTHRVAFYAAVVAVFALTGIYWLSLHDGGGGGGEGAAGSSSSSEEVSPRTAMSQGISSASNASGGATKNKEELDEEDVDPMKITQDSVSYHGGKTLAYYHCGPSHVENLDLTELILLHGAAFTKEDWKTSGILDMLCEINNEEDEGNLSVTALDLPVSADGKELASAFDALASSSSSDGVLSGRPATFVSPSASGKAMVGLGEMASSSSSSGGGASGSSELARIVKGWIPVASGAVVGASESTLLQYKSAKIPILAIHGDQDAMGAKVTEKLKKVNDATGVELEGRHPVYLDSPEEFVQEVMQFLDQEGL